ncbi:ABC transporter ATP-binding protein [Robertmurraya andreesenii]|uniref:ABC-2 type transport system ATP-binding protein n=1 Tax=Anoxybacillus andreesenii TaxID=1325932 RepID=A0ABT9UYS8_9BACL|nr:ABC transporter ATP-binding protein [Robertmurraya andreesenii]MDQ0153843.1 ABC-2 type transport system ATP-binding protein [Robertmurraya andreesenii]
MLEVFELTKRFKNKEAVKGINFYMEKGEIVGLLGPNGAGKSTTISMISSLVLPTTGDVRLRNESVLKKPEKIRKVLGVVPQDIALYMDLTARENLEFFGRIHKIKKNDLKKRIEEVLEIIGLKDREKDLVKTFSGGMKRRLNIGVALLHEPELIIMDEPTVGIDPQSRNYILETVKRLNEEKQITVLYTSHYMEEVEYLCDRIYIMDHGEVIASGTKDEIKSILSQEQTLVIQVEILKGEFLKGLEALPNIKNISVNDPILKIIVPKKVNILNEIFVLAGETNTNISSVQIETPTLEDVFLHLTGRQLRD